MARFEITAVLVKSYRAELVVEAATPIGAEREARAMLEENPREWKLWHEEDPNITWIRKLITT
jgi:hypothetical protein